MPFQGICIVGSSGWENPLVNTLLGDEWLWTGEVNEVTGKGRHTTVARELVLLKHGGLLIDNPGIREIQMWTDEHTLRESFADLTELAQECKFADCSHGTDSGCAIRKAVEEGTLDRGGTYEFPGWKNEIARLAKRQKKRQMNVERAGKRRPEGTGPEIMRTAWSRNAATSPTTAAMTDSPSNWLVKPQRRAYQ